MQDLRLPPSLINSVLYLILSQYRHPFKNIGANYIQRCSADLNMGAKDDYVFPDGRVLRFDGKIVEPKGWTKPEIDPGIKRFIKALPNELPPASTLDDPDADRPVRRPHLEHQSALEPLHGHPRAIQKDWAIKRKSLPRNQVTNVCQGNDASETSGHPNTNIAQLGMYPPLGPSTPRDLNQDTQHRPKTPFEMIHLHLNIPRGKGKSGGRHKIASRPGTPNYPPQVPLAQSRLTAAKLNGQQPQPVCYMHPAGHHVIHGRYEAPQQPIDSPKFLNYNQNQCADQYDCAIDISGQLFNQLGPVTMDEAQYGATYMPYYQSDLAKSTFNSESSYDGRSAEVGKSADGIVDIECKIDELEMENNSCDFHGKYRHECFCHLMLQNLNEEHVN
jgi:hypothetical protein